MTKCDLCDQLAEYISPANLCGECWASWFVQNRPDDETQLDPETQRMLYDDIMEVVRRRRSNDE